MSPKMAENVEPCMRRNMGTAVLSMPADNVSKMKLYSQIKGKSLQVKRAGVCRCLFYPEP